MFCRQYNITYNRKKNPKGMPKEDLSVIFKKFARANAHMDFKEF